MSCLERCRGACFAGGAEKHAWCEALLLEDGSRQRDLWGANWTSFNQSIDKTGAYFYKSTI